MEYVIGIIIWLFIIVYFIAQNSKKTTTKERYGEAVGQLAQMTADKISGIAHSVTEPANKKTLRIAREALASRNGSLYRFDWYSDKEYINQLLTIDDNFKKTLDTLNLSNDRWLKIAHKLLYIGAIRQISRENSDYTKKIPKYTREKIAYEWGKEDDCLKDMVEMLYTALAYFNIDIDEWVKYGDTVVEMHDLTSDKDLDDFGDIVAIMPMKNNRHLL